MNICAPATAHGGALAIIRISGPDAITTAARIFKTASGKSLTAAAPQTIHYGEIEGIDEALALVFRTPHSFTGEDCVEFSCHGSRYIVDELLALLCANGCRMAEPGEFTKRAFLNGKLDLSQAEAVADLIASSSRASHQMALSQLKGGFSHDLANLRSQLLHLTTLLELELDFSDHEELEFADRSELIAIAVKTEQRITYLTDSFRQGNAIKNGIPVAIVGSPNAGKSTLLNALLKEEKAIVSDIPGTTRDYIEGLHTINGHLFRFIDTAGLRQTTDKIESLGIARTRQKMEEAQIILWLADKIEAFDSVNPLDNLDKFEYFENFENLEALKDFDEKESPKTIKLLTKFDLQPVPCQTVLPSGVLPISAKTGHNLPELQARLSDIADTLTASDTDIIVTNARHHVALQKAQDSIRRVISGLTTGLPTDLVAEDLRDVLHHLAEITGGEITTAETLSNVFKNFCIGK